MGSLSRPAIQDGAGAAAVLAGGERLIGIGDVDEVMRHARTFFERGLGGAKVHAAIDGNGVATDDLAVKLFCGSKRKRGLAATSRPQYEHRERIDGPRRFCAQGAARRLRRTHGRHQPGGKIH
jgi:hypothetical protein